jgi:hypothetical protein
VIVIIPASIFHFRDPRLLTLSTVDFVVTIPFSFVAERWGVKVVLLSNLVPRVGMSIWAITVGMLSVIL